MAFCFQPIDHPVSVVTLVFILAEVNNQVPPLGYIFVLDKDNNFVICDGARVLKPDPNFIVLAIQTKRDLSSDDLTSKQSSSSSRQISLTLNSKSRICQINKLYSIHSDLRTPEQNARLNILLGRSIRIDPSISFGKQKLEKAHRNLMLDTSRKSIMNSESSPISSPIRTPVITRRGLIFHRLGTPSGIIQPDSHKSIICNMSSQKTYTKGNEVYDDVEDPDLDTIAEAFKALKKEKHAIEYFNTQGLSDRNER
ncbi:hypothetical protein HK096_002587 [Nowakowskiella sp. JEL0078]|nr:hypothetical protein HK096_002587 [Nowakowskiella sp. JEL0078]